MALPFGASPGPRGAWLGPLCVSIATAATAPSALAADGDRSAKSALAPLPTEYVVEDDGWVKLGYHPSARERLRTVLPRLGEIRDELREALGADVLDDVEIRVAALDAEMVRLTPSEAPSAHPGAAPPKNASEPTAPSGDDSSEGAAPAASSPTRSSIELASAEGGGLFPAQHLIVLSAGPKPGGDLQDIEPVLRYQLARLALSDALARGERPPAEVPGWFERGFATHFARARESSRAETLMLAALKSGLPHFAELGKTARDPDTEGAFAADFARFVLESGDRSAMPTVIDKLKHGEQLDAAVAGALGSDPAEVDRAWRKDMGKRYGLFPVLAASLLFWLALWLVGAWRQRRAQTIARGRSAQRARIRDALVPKGVRDRDAVDASRPRGRLGDDPPASLLRADSAIFSSSHGEGDKLPEVEVPKIEHDGGWHTLH